MPSNKNTIKVARSIQFFKIQGILGEGFSNLGEEIAILGENIYPWLDHLCQTYCLTIF